jgi:hypothetical protein
VPVDLAGRAGHARLTTVLHLAHRKDFQPWRLAVQFHPCTRIDARPLVDQLSFVKDLSHWGLPFRRGLFTIPQDDFSLISDRMRPSDHRLPRICILQERGYVTRGTDPRHACRMRLQVTPLGFEVLRTGEAIFDEPRDQWERQIGTAQLENLERHLAELVGTPPVRFDTPGWMSRDLGEPI